METETFEVESFSLGDKLAGDKIVFKSLEDLNRAYKEIDNGRDIYICHEGEITILPYRMLSTKLYDGSITLSAMKTTEKSNEKLEDKGE